MGVIELPGGLEIITASTMASIISVGISLRDCIIAAPHIASVGLWVSGSYNLGEIACEIIYNLIILFAVI